jgi:uncharacterized protein YjbI with pentapeptide repeats
MSRADLRVANFRDARMDGIDLEEARLIGACMKGVSLRGAWLAGADLRGAKIRGANLTGATLANALVWRAGGDGGTSLGPTDLRGITVARGPGSPLDAISDAAFGPLFREVERECEPQDTRDRFTRDIADDGSTGPFEKASSNGNVLIAVELDGAVRKNIAGGSGLTTDPGEFALAIAGFQRSVACVDLALALSVRTYGLDDLVLAELARNSRTSGCSFDPSGAQRFRRR